MELEKDFFKAIKIIVVVLILLIIGKFFIYDEYFAEKEENIIKQPEKISKNELIIEENNTENDTNETEFYEIFDQE